MAHVGTLTPNETLMGLESEARDDFEKILASWDHPERAPDFVVQHTHAAPGLRFIVTYHPLRSWGYEFSAIEGGLRGKFDSRDSCLVALAWHMTEAS